MCSYQAGRSSEIEINHILRIFKKCIIAGTLEELKEADFGAPLHCMIICGEVHDLELESLRPFLVPNSVFQIDAEGTLFKREDEAVEDDDED